MKAYYLLLYFVTCINAASPIYRLHESQYSLMPPVVSMDPYDSCMKDAGAQYCSGHVHYVTDEPSPLLNMMQDYTAHTASHFNHTQSFIAICFTEKCKKFIHRDVTTLDLLVTLEECLNHTFSEHYNLKVKLEDDTICRGKDAKRFEIGMFDIIIAAILIALAILNVIGSLLDIQLANLHEFLGGKCLQCFSIPRNWKNLEATYNDQKFETLKGLYGLRSFIMTLIIIGHSHMPAALTGTHTKAIEEAYEIAPLYIFISGSLSMQLFFLMSAFLQVYLLQVYAETHAIKWKLLPVGIMMRLIRLTPVYALTLAIISTWFKHLSAGPLWDVAVTGESMSCSQAWWKHLLYINNYVTDEKKCMPHTWFLAADTQLFCLGMIIYIICHKSRLRNVIFTLIFIIGMILPALHTYYQDLDGILIISPNAMMDFFVNNQFFHKSYILAHTNIPGYIIGMFTGYLVYYLQKNNFDASKYKKWRIFFWLTFASLFLILMPLKVFYAEGPRIHILYRVLAAAFINPAYATLGAAVLIGTLFKIDHIWTAAMEWRGWQVISQVSYSAYLVHVSLLRLATGTLTELVSLRHMIFMSMTILVSTYVSACVLWLTVEAPIKQLIKLYLPLPGSEENLKTSAGQKKIK